MAVVITTAIKTGSTIAIVGTGFGTKPTAAPYRFRPWTGLTDGAAANSQFDTIERVGGEPSVFVVDNSVGVGGGSLRMEINGASLGGSDIFPHHEFNGFSSDYLYASHWFQYAKQTANAAGNFSQLKSYRAGAATGSGPVDNYANGFPMIGNSWNTQNPANDDTFGINGFYDPDTNTTNPWTDNVGATKAVFSDGLMHHKEIEWIMNTALASGNGVIREWLDGDLISEYTNVNIRLSVLEHFSFVQPNPGWANDLSDNNWKAWESRHYVDTSSCKAFLSDSSTYAGISTGKFLLNISAHTALAITATDASNIPSGYAYLYVVDDAGAVNANGYAFTTSGGTDAHMLFTGKLGQPFAGLL
jgi:hypothetical protein